MFFIGNKVTRQDRILKFCKIQILVFPQIVLGYKIIGREIKEKEMKNAESAFGQVSREIALVGFLCFKLYQCTLYYNIAKILEISPFCHCPFPCPCSPLDSVIDLCIFPTLIVYLPGGIDDVSTLVANLPLESAVSV